jgi:hypothetical protein
VTNLVWSETGIVGLDVVPCRPKRQTACEMVMPIMPVMPIRATRTITPIVQTTSTDRVNSVRGTEVISPPGENRHLVGGHLVLELDAAEFHGDGPERHALPG